MYIGGFVEVQSSGIDHGSGFREELERQQRVYRRLGGGTDIAEASLEVLWRFGNLVEVSA